MKSEHLQPVPNILVVDDEEALKNFLVPFLERCGFSVKTAKNGKEALLIINKEAPDLVLADVVMPEMDGRQLLRELRAKNIWIPVILLTQIGESFEKTIALNEGADDYLNKPFDPPELVARIKAVLRRAKLGEPSLSSAWVLRSGDLLLDRKKKQVLWEEVPIQCTPKAYALLEFLMTHPGEIVSHKRLLSAVWHWEYTTETRTVSNRIVELRRILKDNATSPNFIETVAGQGYRFIAAVESVALK